MYLLMQRYFYDITKAVVQRCFVKKLFLKLKTYWKTPVLEVDGLRPAPLLKRDSSTIAFT